MEPVLKNYPFSQILICFERFQHRHVHFLPDQNDNPPKCKDWHELRHLYLLQIRAIIFIWCVWPWPLSDNLHSCDPGLTSSCCESHISSKSGYRSVENYLLVSTIIAVNYINRIVSFYLLSANSYHWSRHQHVWLPTKRSRVRFPELPHFKMWNSSGTRSSQPREDNWVATWLIRSVSD